MFLCNAKAVEHLLDVTVTVSILKRINIPMRLLVRSGPDKSTLSEISPERGGRVKHHANLLLFKRVIHPINRQVPALFIWLQRRYYLCMISVKDVLHEF